MVTFIEQCAESILETCFYKTSVLQVLLALSIYKRAFYPIFLRFFKSWRNNPVLDPFSYSFFRLKVFHASHFPHSCFIYWRDCQLETVPSDYKGPELHHFSLCSTRRSALGEKKVILRYEHFNFACNVVVQFKYRTAFFHFHLELFLTYPLT